VLNLKKTLTKQNSMSEFKLKGSTKTPEVHFNSTNGVLEMKGRSIPEISYEFYQPIIDWVDAYSQNPQEETLVHAKFEYFNTSSSKSILDFFKRLEQIHKNGKSNVTVKWFCAQDDEAMEEAGEEYKMLLTMPFEIVPLNEEEE